MPRTRSVASMLSRELGDFSLHPRGRTTATGEPASPLTPGDPARPSGTCQTHGIRRPSVRPWRVAMSDLDDFLTLTLTRQVEAEQALINGAPTQRLAMTSTQDPVTTFGAEVPLRRGWDEVSETLCWLAARWSDSIDYRFDLVAAGVSGHLAYLVGFEHIANSVVGIPVEPCTFASPTSSAAKTASGGSPTATPTTSRSIRPLPPTHRRSRRSSSESGPRRGTSGPHPSRASGTTTVPRVAQHPSSAALFAQHHRSWDHPGSPSHGGGQSFKPLPQPPKAAIGRRHAAGG